MNVETYRALQEAGVAEELASAAASQVVPLEALATKTDVLELKGEIVRLDGKVDQLDSKVDRLGNELESEIVKVESSIKVPLSRWMLWLGVGLVTLMLSGFGTLVILIVNRVGNV